MKGIASLFLGIFGTFVFSWIGLILVPNYQIGNLNPQTDEDGNDPYPIPKSGMAERGRRIYAANGCVYCHSQQVRADYAGPDIERKWGDRRSAPRDYLYDRPIVLGKMRVGPDLSNIGKRAPVESEGTPAAASPAPSVAAAQGTPSANSTPAATGSPTVAGSPAPVSAQSVAPSPTPETGTTDNLPKYSAAWHHRHLYNPRSLVRDSTMPAFHFLYEKRRVSGEPSADALVLGDKKELSGDWELVPTYDAKCLVAYLMSLDQSHALKEVTQPPGPASSAAASAKGTK